MGATNENSNFDLRVKRVKCLTVLGVSSDIQMARSGLRKQNTADDIFMPMSW